MDSDSEGRQVRPVRGTKGALIGCHNNKHELYRSSDISSDGFCPANYNPRHIFAFSYILIYSNDSKVFRRRSLLLNKLNIPFMSIVQIRHSLTLTSFLLEILEKG